MLQTVRNVQNFYLLPGKLQIKIQIYINIMNVFLCKKTYCKPFDYESLKITTKYNAFKHILDVTEFENIILILRLNY